MFTDGMDFMSNFDLFNIILIAVIKNVVFAVPQICCKGLLHTDVSNLSFEELFDNLLETSLLKQNVKNKSSVFYLFS